MTDYNDGNWHGWNGGECPVHPKTIVEYVWVQDGRTGISERNAGHDPSGAEPAWSFNIKAFRVIKQHREPREMWLREDMPGIWNNYAHAVHGAVLFREVLK